MALIEKTCTDADEELASYIFKSVTEGRSYANLQIMYDMPFSKDKYHDRYRKFFWILSTRRN